MRRNPFLRSLLERLIAPFGYELKLISAPLRGFPSLLRYVQNCGFQPKTVFDVGVGHGTPWLYRAFPDAHFVLLEPRLECEAALKAICSTIDAEYHLTGVGSEEGSRPLYRLTNSPTGSSFLAPTETTERIWGQFELTQDALPIVPLDIFLGKDSPHLIKLDTEGMELEALKGARGLLAATELILLEAAVRPRQIGEADFIEIAAFLKGIGFRLFDFPAMAQERRSKALLYVDVAFIKVGGVIDNCVGIS